MNDNYKTTYETYTIGKKTYRVKVTYNEPSDEALENLAKLILKIF